MKQLKDAIQDLKQEQLDPNNQKISNNKFLI